MLLLKAITIVSLALGIFIAFYYFIIPYVRAKWLYYLVIKLVKKIAKEQENDEAKKKVLDILKEIKKLNKDEKL